MNVFNLPETTGNFDESPWEQIKIFLRDKLFRESFVYKLFGIFSVFQNELLPERSLQDRNCRTEDPLTWGQPFHKNYLTIEVSAEERVLAGPSKAVGRVTLWPPTAPRHFALTEICSLTGRDYPAPSQLCTLLKKQQTMSETRQNV